MSDSPCQSLDKPDVDVEVPHRFRIDSKEAANWVVRKINEARAYARRCDEWCEREKARAAKTEEFLLRRLGRELEDWAKGEIAEQGARRKSVHLPAGAVGFRRQPPRLVVDDDSAVFAWCKLHHPELLVVREHVSKDALNKHITTTGELPDVGVHLEPEHERFFVS